MIDVEHLVKRYGDSTAVDGISFTAQPGQVTGFLGPNGAGKTTTMRILTGFMPPTSGKAAVAGFDVFEDSLRVRQQVGYLPENVPLYRDMTARGYLMYLAEIRGLKRRRQLADAVLDRVGLIDRADSRIRTLSKGMRQRVGLAQALLHNPPVLILDEPTIGLDPLQVLELRDLVKELGRDHTVLFSTHILSEAEQVCDKVVILYRGAIVAQGAPAQLRSDLERGGRVLVRVNAPPTEAVALLHHIEGVAHAMSGSDGVIITPAGAHHDPRPQIARAILDKGWDLMEMRPLAINLEDIFFEVTRRQTTEQIAAEAHRQTERTSAERMEEA